jgi:hypothetical protein
MTIADESRIALTTEIETRFAAIARMTFLARRFARTLASFESFVRTAFAMTTTTTTTALGEQNATAVLGANVRLFAETTLAASAVADRLRIAATTNTIFVTRMPFLVGIETGDAGRIRGTYGHQPGQNQRADNDHVDRALRFSKT